jgi:dihydropyrimidinase
MRTLIRGGTVVSATAQRRADVLVEGEQVVGVVDTRGHGWDDDPDVRRLDATDRLVLPGAVDLHTHLELPFRDVVSADDWESGTRAALLGGTTTIVDYAGQSRGGTLADGLATWRARAAGRACADHAFHLMVTDVRPDVLEEFADLVADGVTGFKLFTAYPGTNYSDDGRILEAMQRCAELGATVMMHAENGIAIDVLRAQAVAEGRTAPIHHLLTRPVSLEAEAVHRVVALAEVAGCDLVVVHISSADALAAAVAGRDRGLPVYTETCPQYLVLGIEDLPDGLDAARYVCSPPLRWHRDGHQDALWAGVATGRVDAVATDHCPFRWEDKLLGRDDFTRIPNGLGVIEHRLDLLHQGVVDGRLTLERLVEVACTAPARLAGLHPRKGELAPGADADVVFYDPSSRHVLSHDRHHMAVDHSAFEGVEVTGRVDSVLLRGEVVVDAGVHVGRPGQGREIPRGRNSLAPTTPTRGTR